MPEPFRNFIDAGVVRRIAHHVQRGARQAGVAFDADGFGAQALAGLDDLALKARVQQLADALTRHLAHAARPEAALAALVASLGPPVDLDAPAATAVSADPPPPGDGAAGADGVSGWAVWPLTEAVVLIALDAAPAAGLAALGEMTRRMSAEFALRPFIVRHPALAFDTLAGWARDPDAQLRRLASEGSRPRLPWGLRLQALVHDPSPTLPLLRQLQDDPSPSVRRSVANHLNDIARDHPAVLHAWLAEHLPGAPAPRRALLKHACRGRVKAGDPVVLAAWGQGEPFRGRAALVLDRPLVRVGDALGLTLTLTADAGPGPAGAAAAPVASQHLAVDYAVHHAKAAGHTTAKVFKGWVLDLAPGESRTLTRRHSFRPVTVRRYHDGPHAVDVRINGQVVAQARFELAGAQAP